MAREMPLKTSKVFIAVKLGALTAAVLVALGVGAFGPTKHHEAQAEPLHAVALNEALCIALGSAFGGLPATTAAFGCQGMMEQDTFQTYAACLTKTAACPDTPGFNQVFLRPDTDLLAALDLDKNQIFQTQPYEIVAFVNDDFPVRFITQKGQFLTPDGSLAGQDLFCAPGSLQYPGSSLDPDCDGNSTTVGDGVVVARLITDESDGDSGTFSVSVIQENIAFPLEMTLTGPPEEIRLTTLFGKDTIQTGATACAFEASADAVLGAVGKAEQTIVVAKALDTHGVEVVGALLTWHLANTLPENPPFGPSDAAWTLNRRDEGGVALPQTPTIDAGPLGVAFPQFVCGGIDTGTIDLEVVFDPILSSAADPNEHTPISIKVIGAATDMTLTAEPAVMDCDGTNTSKVTANVVNAAGDPVANGLDVNFSVVALGTANPMRADTAAGLSSTVVQPLAGAGNLTGDGGPKGVTVTVNVKGALTPYDFNPNEDPTWKMVERSILVQCTGGPPPVGTGGAPAGAGSGPATGSIRPPDTGSAGVATGTLGWSMLAALVAAGFALGSVGLATRRK